MTFQNLENVVEENDDFDVIDVGRGVEFWSDGNLARFGTDVVSGKCVEISIIEIDDFCETVKSCETDTFSFTGRYGNDTYLFEDDHPAVYVYHNQEHVVSFENHEKFPLSSIKREIEEEKIDWDVEDTAERIVSQYLSVNDKLSVEKKSQNIASVEIKSQFMKTGKLIELCNIDHIPRNHKPSNVSIDSEDQFINLVSRYLNNVNIYVNDDGSVCYRFYIDTQSFHN